MNNTPEIIKKWNAKHDTYVSYDQQPNAGKIIMVKDNSHEIRKITDGEITQQLLEEMYEHGTW